MDPDLQENVTSRREERTMLERIVIVINSTLQKIPEL